MSGLSCIVADPSALETLQWEVCRRGKELAGLVANLATRPRFANARCMSERVSNDTYG